MTGGVTENRDIETCCNILLEHWDLTGESKMVKTAISILAVMAAAGIALTPVAASAATRPAVLATSSTTGGGDPDTTVTFTVTSTGALSMTAPTSVDLGTGAVGDTISGNLGGPVTVTDNRALDAAAWTVTASSTNWTTGAGTGTETIPAGDVTYAPGTIGTTGVITATGSTITLANAAVLPAVNPTVVAGTAGVGDNSATWDPTISVAVPAGAVAGAYTGTLTQSVA
jgi:hypothetical protein